MNCVGNCVIDTLTAVVEVNNHSDETHLNTLNYTITSYKTYNLRCCSYISLIVLEIFHLKMILCYFLF